MKTYDKLLAKSHRGGNEITLLEHTIHVMDAAEALFGTAAGPTRLGRCWLRFFKLGADAWPTFHANLLAACALHDWGKANDGFQDEMEGKRGSQAIRHEHLSALLIGLPQVTNWLEAAEPKLDVPVVLSAVLTHHLKAAFDATKRYGFGAVENAKRQFRPLLLNPFRELAAMIATRLKLGPLDLKSVPASWTFDTGHPTVRDMRDRVKKDVLESLRGDFTKNPARRRMLVAVRAALIAADGAGSGLIREGKTISNWIAEQFDHRGALDGQAIWDKVIRPRIEQLSALGRWKDAGDGKRGWTDFQLDAGNPEKLPARALLLAPCGAGKTLAAWQWIAARAAEHAVARVLFLYPTRATAKEGFKDYVSWAPDADAALVHGTAEFDLVDMFDNEDPRHGQCYETERRLFSLRFWSNRIFSATVDQFLAFLQHGYGPTCLLPVLADSVVVIDEVHSFDRNMFSALKEFLRNFDVPVLCMTATLPTDRREQLTDAADDDGCGLTPYDDKPGELDRIATLPRYRLENIVSREIAIARVRESLQSGRRVLWVVNTVARCHEIVKTFAAGFDPSEETSRLRTAEGIPIYCYHSRFKLSDRVNRHKDVVDNMRATGAASLCVTTQVCEMSLDLDADLLVTEECPVTSLIQRMGRCNRDRNARPLDRSGEVLVYPPESEAPYEANDLKGLPEFLNLVGGRDLSQVDLEAALNDPATPCPEWQGDRTVMFLASGPYAVGPKADEDDANTFREGNDFNRPSILLNEVGDYLAAGAAAKPGFELPVPRRSARARDDDKHPSHKQLPLYLSVSEPGHYHPAIGFYDQPLDQWGAR